MILSKEQIDFQFNSAYENLEKQIEGFEAEFENDEFNLKKLHEMKRDLKSLKFHRNEK